MIYLTVMQLSVLVGQADSSGIKVSDTIPYAVVMAIGGVFSYAIKSLIDRKSISAVAKKEEATAADIVAGAAAELINPLREELSTTRAEVIQLRTELAANTREMHQLTIALESSTDRNQKLEARNTELERENAELKESCRENDKNKARVLELERENAELKAAADPGNA